MQSYLVITDTIMTVGLGVGKRLLSFTVFLIVHINIMC